MFGFELDMLEVVLHEIYPVVDFIYVTESTVTHSLGKKPLLWDSVKAEPRFDRFAGKISHNVFTPAKKFKSGWDIEKRQRAFFLKFVAQNNITDSDILLGNIDLDELMTRETLVRMKHCETPDLTFKLVQFRYNLNCLQEVRYTAYYTTTFYWRDRKGGDLYSRRRASKPVPFDVGVGGEGVVATLRGMGAWHMTAFGGVPAVMRKYENSPHRFVGTVSRADVARNIGECRYNDKQRTALGPRGAASAAWFARGNASTATRLNAVALPYLIAQNLCSFAERGWLML
jgi:hypothetical protein